MCPAEGKWLEQTRFFMRTDEAGNLFRFGENTCGTEVYPVSICCWVRKVVSVTLTIVSRLDLAVPR